MNIFKFLVYIILIVVILAVGGYFGVQYFLPQYKGAEYLLAHPRITKFFQITPVCPTECVQGEVCGKDGKNYCNSCVALKNGAGYSHDGACLPPNWETYKNSQYGFEFSHPVSCKENNTEEKEGYFDYNRTKVVTITCGITKWAGPNTISFYVDSSDKNIQKCLSGQETSGLNFIKKDINGSSFSYLSYEDAAMGGQRALVNNYAIVSSNKCFQIDSGVRYGDLSFLAGVTNKKFTADDQKQHDLEIKQMGDLLNKIIATFKFTK